MREYTCVNGRFPFARVLLDYGFSCVARRRAREPDARRLSFDPDDGTQGGERRETMSRDRDEIGEREKLQKRKLLAVNERHVAHPECFELRRLK